MEIPKRLGIKFTSALAVSARLHREICLPDTQASAADNLSDGDVVSAYAVPSPQEP